MNVIPFVHEGLGNSSYLVDTGDGRALLIDPDREVERYFQVAVQRDLEIMAVLETHLHADFVSGVREAGARGPIRLFVPAGARVPFPHLPAREGEPVTLDGVQVEVLHTPGHTPEHVSYVLRPAAGPPMLFSGGSLIVGGAARSDLVDPALTDRLTRDQYHSVRRLLALPDETLLYPTHGAGSFCSTGGGAERTSTLGRERRENPVFAAVSEDEFADWFPRTFPAAPEYFFRLRRLNHAGPRLVREIPMPRPLAPREFDTARLRGTVVDVRPVAEFSVGHIGGSLSNHLRDAFSVWLGWLLPLEAALLFVGGEREVGLAVKEALMVGFERFAGYLAGGIEAWQRQGLPLESRALVDAAGARALLSEGAVPVDVRERDEYEAGHIPGAIHIPLGKLRDKAWELPSGRPLLVYCAAGERASTGLSLLSALGFEDVANLQGGFGAWQKAGFATTRE